MNQSASRYAIAGNPVAHSQSPFIHARFAAATGEAVDYGRLLCPLEPAEAFGHTLRRFANEGGQGCNVTVPFKFEAFKLGTRSSARAALAQAANVLRFDAEGWFADNADGAGLLRDIEQNAGVALAGRRVLLIGAGGAAAGALGALIGAAPKLVAVINRTADKAVQLVARHEAHAARHGVALLAGGLADAGLAYDVVINASASSMQGAAVPVAPTVLRPGTLALDMMYGTAARPFLDWAASHDAQGRDGLGMLVEQAAESFLLWRGVRPATAEVLFALSAKMAAA